jgi:transglutaminase-like putative cysteine protease
MKKLIRPSLALAPTLLLALGGCRFGIGLGGVGFGMGVGAVADGPNDTDDPQGLRLDSKEISITVHDDLTCDAVTDATRTVVSAAGITAGQRADVTFDPDTQSVEMVEAYVTRPGGTRVDVTKDNVFTRPSAAAQDTPGFAHGRTTSVVFPQLAIGTSTHVRWKFADRSHSTLGFSYVFRPPFSLAAENVHVTVTAPANVNLRSAGRDGFEVKETKNANGTVTVDGTLRGYAAGRREPGMISPKDVVPLFVVSTVESWEAIGARFRASAAPSIEATPEIEAKAAELANGKKGIEVVRAISRWVTRDVNYVAVRLDASDAWVPHRASEVLKNGYGDCKDQYALLASLLAARGIACEAVLIGRDGGMDPLPVPTPRQFDHCIGYIPEFDVYVDPTATFCDFGQLDLALRGKFVVHATENGKTSRTPRGRAEDNTYAIANSVKVLADGTIEGMSEIGATGRQAQLMRHLLASRDGELVAADLLVQTPEGGEGKVTSTDPTDMTIPFQVRGRWRSERAVEMGPTVFFRPPTGIDYSNPMRARGILADGDRRYPAVISAADYRWVHNEELPTGYDVTRLPAGRSVSNSAGSYTSKWVVDSPGHIRIERHLRVDSELIPPGAFPELRDLLEAFTRDSREIVVLRGPATPN